MYDTREEVLRELLSNKYEVCGPHCDSRILHGPGQCTVCDKFPELQLGRIWAGINFTGERMDGKVMCPSEQSRALETIELWPNNRPFLDLPV